MPLNLHRRWLFCVVVVVVVVCCCCRFLLTVVVLVAVFLVVFFFLSSPLSFSLLLCVVIVDCRCHCCGRRCCWCWLLILGTAVCIAVALLLFFPTASLSSLFFFPFVNCVAFPFRGLIVPNRQSLLEKNLLLFLPFTAVVGMAKTDNSRLFLS